jgi:adenylate kinase
MAKTLYVVLLGAPGAGKGTQAASLAAELDIAHVSSGDLFRENLKNGTELGLLAKSYMDKGELVPDEVTISMVRARLGLHSRLVPGPSGPTATKRRAPPTARRSVAVGPDRAVGEAGRDGPGASGAILDGFPRTLAQARALDMALAEQGQRLTVVPLIQVGDEEVMRRLTGRRVCRQCGAVYHLVFNPPRVEGVCDACGGQLYQREDDLPETVRHRLYTYYKETGPLIGYYFAKDLLVEIDGERAIDAVQADLRRAMLMGDARRARSWDPMGAERRRDA